MDPLLWKAYYGTLINPSPKQPRVACSSSAPGKQHSGASQRKGVNKASIAVLLRVQEREHQSQSSKPRPHTGVASRVVTKAQNNHGIIYSKAPLNANVFGSGIRQNSPHGLKPKVPKTPISTVPKISRWNTQVVNWSAGDVSPEPRGKFICPSMP